MTQIWKNDKGEPVIELEIEIDEDKGVTLKVNKEVKAKHGKEIEELQTLNLYPPKDEEKIEGVTSADGEWTTYEFKKGKNWEFAQKDITKTCEFWAASEATKAMEQPLLQVME